MYETILVPTDGSDPAAIAVEGGLALADRFDASLHGIHVLELGDLPADTEFEATERLTQRGEAMLAPIAKRAADVGVTATTHVLESTGSVHREIIDYARVHDVDLIVMGTHGRTGLDRLVLGSVTERTLRVSPVPVLTVHEDGRLDADLESVLVPTDGSDAANAAADHAIDLAAATEAALHIVNVVDVTAAWSEVDNAAIFEAFEEEGQRAVDDIIERADAAGLQSVEASVLTGTPARAITDYVDEFDMDLVVMGTQGRTGLERYLLGSVTEKVVRVSTSPVLTVSTPDNS